jgi:hypothetical protein
MLDGIVDSWLELVIARPTGAAHVEQTDDAGVEPRTVTIAPHGPRWGQ